MSGLGLISLYTDDEDDSCDETIQQPLERPQISSSTINSPSSTPRLPLPSTINQLFLGSPDVNNAPEDNPNLHEGRIRSFPHQRGNWSTYVYVPYVPENGFSKLLTKLIVCAASAGVQLKTVADPHISLTRTVVLQHHWIHSFVSSIKSNLGQLSRVQTVYFNLTGESFKVHLGKPAVYCNEERTCTFLGLNVVSGSVQLLEATTLMDQCLSEFRLPPFYKEASFHMSILWLVGDATIALDTMLPQLHSEFNSYSLDYPDELTIDVTQCLCKTGNKIYSLPLS